ncbi:hypothetical protein BSL78_08267 [Apostichopus japonicus]|uniref:Uncharacterized protein n=1 Tax=Stichopus japonicus TaxID=307972 RepID=A0A2G8L3M6_STIJA|nr:hypothetical protein BSL78_08267 [Apostichopus japonicus]
MESNSEKSSDDELDIFSRMKDVDISDIKFKSKESQRDFMIKSLKSALLDMRQQVKGILKSRIRNSELKKFSKTNEAFLQKQFREAFAVLEWALHCVSPFMSIQDVLLKLAENVDVLDVSMLQQINDDVRELYRSELDCPDETNWLEELVKVMTNILHTFNIPLIDIHSGFDNMSIKSEFIRSLIKVHKLFSDNFFKENVDTLVCDKESKGRLLAILITNGLFNNGKDTIEMINVNETMKYGMGDSAMYLSDSSEDSDLFADTVSWIEPEPSDGNKASFRKRTPRAHQRNNVKQHDFKEDEDITERRRTECRLDQALFQKDQQEDWIWSDGEDDETLAATVKHNDTSEDEELKTMTQVQIFDSSADDEKWFQSDNRLKENMNTVLKHGALAERDVDSQHAIHLESGAEEDIGSNELDEANDIERIMDEKEVDEAVTKAEDLYDKNTEEEQRPTYAEELQDVGTNQEITLYRQADTSQRKTGKILLTVLQKNCIRDSMRLTTFLKLSFTKVSLPLDQITSDREIFAWALELLAPFSLLGNTMDVITTLNKKRSFSDLIEAGKIVQRICDMLTYVRTSEKLTNITDAFNKHIMNDTSKANLNNLSHNFQTTDSQFIKCLYKVYETLDGELNGCKGKKDSFVVKLNLGVRDVPDGMYLSTPEDFDVDLSYELHNGKSHLSFPGIPNILSTRNSTVKAKHDTEQMYSLKNSLTKSKNRSVGGNDMIDVNTQEEQMALELLDFNSKQEQLDSDIKLEQERKLTRFSYTSSSADSHVTSNELDDEDTKEDHPETSYGFGSEKVSDLENLMFLDKDTEEEQRQFEMQPGSSFLVMIPSIKTHKKKKLKNRVCWMKIQKKQIFDVTLTTLNVIMTFLLNNSLCTSLQLRQSSH